MEADSSIVLEVVEEVGEVVVVLELEVLELLEECHTKVFVLFGVEIHQ